MQPFRKSPVVCLRTTRVCLLLPHVNGRSVSLNNLQSESVTSLRPPRPAHNATLSQEPHRVQTAYILSLDGDVKPCDLNEPDGLLTTSQTQIHSGCAFCSGTRERRSHRGCSAPERRVCSFHSPSFLYFCLYKRLHTGEEIQHT